MSVSLSLGVPERTIGPSTGATRFAFPLKLCGRPQDDGPVAFIWTVIGSGAQPAVAEDFVGGVLPSGAGSFPAGSDVRTISFATVGGTDAGKGFVVSVSAMIDIDASAVELVRPDSPRFISLPEITTANPQPGEPLEVAFTATDWSISLVELLDEDEIVIDSMEIVA